MATKRDLWVRESPMPVAEGEVLELGIKWSGSATVTSPVTTVYKNGNDYSATVHLSGDTDRASGLIQVGKKITVAAGDFGQSYVVEFAATVDGQQEKRFWQLDVIRSGEEM